jgi:hypothetical protein
MARPARFERTTIRLEGGCSIQLSYGRGLAHLLCLFMAKGQAAFAKTKGLL